MQIPKAPSWPVVILSGSAGGAVHWFSGNRPLGYAVFVLMMLLLTVLIRKPT